MENNTRSAPKLIFNGKKLPNEREYWYQIPIKLSNYLMNTISGNNGNAIKLLWVLLGSSEGFNISESMILKRTGMNQSAYIRARKYLCELGIIEHINEKGHHAIIINFGNLWKAANNYENYEIEYKKELEENTKLIDEGVLNDINGRNEQLLINTVNNSFYRNNKWMKKLSYDDILVDD